MNDEQIKQILEDKWKTINSKQQITQSMIVSFRMGLDESIRDYCSCGADVTQLIDDSTGNSGEVIFCHKCGKVIMGVK